MGRRRRDDRETDPLAGYREKRSFETTPEPVGEGAPAAEGELPRFVVQEHSARRLHWDLRLEHEGALASWALPKGLPDDPSQKRMAVRTEDHPLTYLDFAGTIPEGSYGAGEMRIVDRGSYVAEEFEDGKVSVELRGERLGGRFHLFRTKGDDWLIRRRDPPDPARAPLPEGLEPMLATAARELPRDDGGWGYEIKWDGIRALCRCRIGELELVSRNGRTITDGYPEVKRLVRQVGIRDALLDGELAALDEQGRPSFQLLQRRINLGSEREVRRRARSTPVTYLIFDLLHLDGESLLELPYRRRRELLAELELEGEAWRTPAFHRGEGGRFAAAVRERGLEGVVAKRLDGSYVPGRRSRDWLKVKNVRTQDVVIGGISPGSGVRSGTIGALLCGYWVDGDDGPELRYAGKVGTGFTERTLAELERMLDLLRTDRSPFSGRQPPKGTSFVEPRLVAEVEFTEWTQAGTLRAPSFKGLRPDKPVTDVRREEPGDA